MSSPADPRPWRRLYGTARWKRLRDAHLTQHPLCYFCIDAEEVTAADVVDHVRMHKGDETSFFDPDNLQSLCKPHHDGTKQRLERGALDTRLDASGWPEWRGGQ